MDDRTSPSVIGKSVPDVRARLPSIRLMWSENDGVNPMPPGTPLACATTVMSFRISL